MSALAPSLVRPFQLERFFAVHEFSTRHLLCCSDVEPATMAELLALADAECKALWDGLTLGYTESGGLPLLREAIAKLYGGAVCADDVLCCVPMEGILLAHAVRTRRGVGGNLSSYVLHFLTSRPLAHSCCVRVTTWWPPRRGTRA